jgi:hypothetical protein
LAQARAFFNQFHNDFFRSLYFGFSPLLTVPMYRDNRSMAVAKAGAGSKATSFWEHEAMANYLGHQNFAHPDSVTQNLLKTAVVGGSGDTTTVKVTAYGYEGIPRVDIIPLYGGDGRWHEVPVPWTEYIPVSAESQILVGAIRDLDNDEDADANKGLEGTWQAAIQKNGVAPENVFIRGALAATFLRK